MNALQKRLFEEARKRNPNLKVPSETQPPGSELTAEDIALLKQGVGDKSSRAPGSQPASSDEEAGFQGGDQNGVVVKYFDDKGFGFIRPEGGGKDVFFHVSRLVEGLAEDLVPNAKVAYEVGMDRMGKTAATNLRILPKE